MNDGLVAPVVRMVTFLDVGASAGPRRVSVSARHEVELGDGRRVLFLDDRGWSAADASRQGGRRTTSCSASASLGASAATRVHDLVELVDDDPMVQASVQAILAAAEDIAVVAEAADGRQALEQARARRPDVVLLDIRMPVLDGLDAAATLRRSSPPRGGDVDDVLGERVRGPRAGQRRGRFLLKSGDPYELMAAVRAAYGGAARMAGSPIGSSSRYWASQPAGRRRRPGPPS